MTPNDRPKAFSNIRQHDARQPAVIQQKSSHQNCSHVDIDRLAVTLQLATGSARASFRGRMLGKHTQSHNASPDQEKTREVLP